VPLALPVHHGAGTRRGEWHTDSLQDVLNRTLARIIHVGWVRKPLRVVGQRSLTIARQQQAAIDYQLVCDDPPMT